MKSRTLSLACALTGLIVSPLASKAADHGDGPRVSSDQGADLGDLYAFVDPNDSDKVILISTVRGFIVPGEANNFASFDPRVQITFQIENTGDEKPDLTIAVNFDDRTQAADRSFSQNAEIKIDGLKGTFTAPITQPTLAGTPRAQVVTDLTNSKNSSTGIKFFAGEVDDPFFFDIPGFSRFVGSVLGGTPDVTTLQRGRDTFAGYNILAVAMSVPKALLLKDGTKLGISCTSNRQSVKVSKKGLKSMGKFQQIDREGVPGINAVIIPFARKDEYNSATPKDDAKLKFAGDILGVLQALGTQGVDASGNLTGDLLTLAQVAVLSGDQLRLETDSAATGFGTGFPNGRKLDDDVIDTILFLVTNETYSAGDNVNANDVPFQSTFPFLAPPQQPRDAGVLDDNTRN